MTKIMGILNVTPDSFSDGGRYNAVEQALEHAKRLVQDGADAIDVGGESTRPGAQFVTADQEIARVVPVIRRLKEELDVLISIDTYKPIVARAALEAGADIINDVWGSKWDDQSMAEVAKEFNVPIILMHNRDNRNYGHFIEEVVGDIQESIAIARAAGVRDDQIWLDPGIGFAKDYNQNLELMNRLDVITNLGFPVLLGTSRKSFIGQTLDLPTEERVEGTVATTCLGIVKGCAWVRVHDVLENKRASRMMDAMLGGGQVG
ncbi:MULTISPECIES: dihydropteroate synthase [unclassified Exiguobacterium]|uniref:dihydropteroate synthase n=1 Tax=unclassified Exiguobacterium TaxID=2644629 RepID=UPI00103B2598|nr:MULTISPECIES: dihydropteroate synthase [unclassified Exiguobacterium]TCI42316.1 dihydropteroate synthase [Exiguobacterium sp. SH5S32]TCI49553.1 dihydropteroate synthase [Exiguobacterium sp. SH1S4]TCI58723.1 dihydropteroate synthase [Exiguobacterium sp. SH0S2]TCI67137.1 dihydropteroate synthase [Exiguobacterium sp. SH1S1]